MPHASSFSLPNEQELFHFASLLSARNRNQPYSSDENTLGLSTSAYLNKLDYHGITLLADAKGQLPQSLHKILKQRKAMMVANSVLKQGALVEIFDALHNIQVSSILFKGGALAHTLYAEPWLRPRSDSDILIELNDFTNVARVLEQLGYAKQFAIEGKHVSYQSTFSKPLAGESVMSIDLHWRINNRQSLSQAFDVASLSNAGQTLETLSSKIAVPNHIDSLLIASLHRLGHHHSEERLAWLYDIHLLANTLTDADWHTLTSKAINKRISGVTQDALITCQRLLKTPVPAKVIDALANCGHEPSRIFLQRHLPEWRYFLADLKAMPSAAAKLGLIKENVFPSADYVRQKMGTKSAFLGYSKRFMRGIKRVMSSS